MKVKARWNRIHRATAGAKAHNLFSLRITRLKRVLPQKTTYLISQLQTRSKNLHEKT
jgi:hypothetical protein